MDEWIKKGVEDRGNEEMLVKGYKLTAIRRISSGNVMYSVMTTVNILRESILNICPEKRKQMLD